jgi:hypothetical protein
MGIGRLVATGLAVVATGLGVGVVGSVQTASACSCAAVTDMEAFESADVVFVGTLVEVPTVDPSSRDPDRYILEVDRVFKGQARERQSVVSVGGRAMCGMLQPAPGPFLVFADDEEPAATSEASDAFSPPAVDGEVFSNMCSGNRSAPAPAAFGPGVEPRSGASGIGPPAARPGRGPAALVGAALVAVVAMAWIVKARRSGSALPRQRD